MVSFGFVSQWFRLVSFRNGFVWFRFAMVSFGFVSQSTVSLTYLSLGKSVVRIEPKKILSVGKKSIEILMAGFLCNY